MAELVGPAWWSGLGVSPADLAWCSDALGLNHVELVLAESERLSQFEIARFSQTLSQARLQWSLHLSALTRETIRDVTSVVEQFQLLAPAFLICGASSTISSPAWRESALNELASIWETLSLKTILREVVGVSPPEHAGSVAITLPLLRSTISVLDLYKPSIATALHALRLQSMPAPALRASEVADWMPQLVASAHRVLSLSPNPRLLTIAFPTSDLFVDTVDRLADVGLTLREPASH